MSVVGRQRQSCIRDSFQVLPALFEGMGATGLLVGFAFFVLMSIAAVTSSISMLEVPVSYAVEAHQINRHNIH